MLNKCYLKLDFFFMVYLNLNELKKIINVIWAIKCINSQLDVKCSCTGMKWPFSLFFLTFNLHKT